MGTGSGIALAVAAALLGCTAPRDAEPSATGCSLAPGTATHEIEVDGRRRRYHVAVGRRAASQETAPLVFLWHGWGASGSSIQRVLEPDRDWPEAIVVAPEGLPRLFSGLPDVPRPGWQIAAGEHEGRDLVFFDALLDDVTRRHCVDPTRTYSTGFSNGGYFANLLGCVRGDRIAAIAPVAGGGPGRGEACRSEVPALIQHGAWDDVVPFEVAQRSFATWSERNACDSVAEAPRSGCEASAGCAAATRFCTFQGGHSWPRGATERIVEFLRAERRGSP